MDRGRPRPMSRAHAVQKTGSANWDDNRHCHVCLRGVFCGRGRPRSREPDQRSGTTTGTAMFAHAACSAAKDVRGPENRISELGRQQALPCLPTRRVLRPRTSAVQKVRPANWNDSRHCHVCLRGVFCGRGRPRSRKPDQRTGTTTGTAMFAYAVCSAAEDVRGPESRISELGRQQALPCLPTQCVLRPRTSAVQRAGSANWDDNRHRHVCLRGVFCGRGRPRSRKPDQRTGTTTGTAMFAYAACSADEDVRGPESRISELGRQQALPCLPTRRVLRPRTSAVQKVRPAIPKQHLLAQH